MSWTAKWRRSTASSSNAPETKRSGRQYDHGGTKRCDDLFKWGFFLLAGLSCPEGPRFFRVLRSAAGLHFVCPSAEAQPSDLPTYSSRVPDRAMLTKLSLLWRTTLASRAERAEGPTASCYKLHWLSRSMMGTGTYIWHSPLTAIREDDDTKGGGDPMYKSASILAARATKCDLRCRGCGTSTEMTATAIRLDLDATKLCNTTMGPEV